MRDQAIQDVLDDALRLLAQGCDAECCAKRFPEHTDQLYPLLLVMEALLDLRTEAVSSAKNLEPRLQPIDWLKVCEPLPAH